jgi:hypothetical protein
MQSFRQTISTGNDYRTLKLSSSTAISGIFEAISSLKNTLFAVRIAYASYIPNKDPKIPPHIHWELFNSN